MKKKVDVSELFIFDTKFQDTYFKILKNELLT